MSAFVEAAAEVAGGGRVGNPLGAQGVEEDLVVASQFDVFQPSAVAQGVVGQVQHVIRLVIGHVDFQQVQAAVDGVDQSDLLCQPMHQADAAGANAADFVGQFDANVRRCKHRLSLVDALAIQSPLDASLGLPQTFRYTVFHSKSSLLRGLGLRCTCPLYPQKQGRFRVFLCNQPERFACLRTSLSLL